MNSKIIDKIKDYLINKPIEKAWLFGSFSRGEENDESDIDLIVEFSKGVRIGLEYFRIIGELEEICERRVDLAESDMLDKRVEANINKDKILIYERAS